MSLVFFFFLFSSFPAPPCRIALLGSCGSIQSSTATKVGRAPFFHPFYLFLPHLFFPVFFSCQNPLTVIRLHSPYSFTSNNSPRNQRASLPFPIHAPYSQIPPSINGGACYSAAARAFPFSYLAMERRCDKHYAVWSLRTSDVDRYALHSMAGTS